MYIVYLIYFSFYFIFCFIWLTLTKLSIQAQQNGKERVKSAKSWIG